MNPFVNIWTRPRSTIRQLIDTNPMKSFFLLTSVQGAVHNLHLVMRHRIDPNSGVSFPVILIYNIVLGALFGIAFFYLFSYLLAWIGRLLRGRGSSKVVRTVLAWACVPYVPLLIALIPVLVIGRELIVFDSQADILKGSIGSAPIQMATSLYFVFRGIMTIWSCIIGIVGMSEALGVSVARSILIYICGLVVLVVPIMGIVILLVETGIV